MSTTISETTYGYNSLTEVEDMALIHASKESPYVPSRTEYVRLLINAGTNLDHRDDHGFTALMWSVSVGNPVSTRLLLEAGADKNATDHFGVTALICATQYDFNVFDASHVEYSHVECARLLVENGVDINVSDKHGCTALMWAAEKGRHECVRYLLSVGADTELEDVFGFTALRMAYRAGRHECVRLLLDNAKNFL